MLNLTWQVLKYCKMNEAEQIQLAHTRLDISGHSGSDANGVGKSLKLEIGRAHV